MANVISFYSDELLSAFLKLGLSLLFAYLGKIDLADYLHSDRSSIIGCNDLKSFTTPRRWRSSQWLDHSLTRKHHHSRQKDWIAKTFCRPRLLVVALCSNLLRHFGIIATRSSDSLGTAS